MSDIIFALLGGGDSTTPPVDNGAVFVGGRILSWEMHTPQMLGTATVGTLVTTASPEAPKALEIGCCDGSWCFRLKDKYPLLVVEGVDDNDHWSCLHEGIVLRCANPITLFSMLTVQ